MFYTSSFSSNILIPTLSLYTLLLSLLTTEAEEKSLFNQILMVFSMECLNDHFPSHLCLYMNRLQSRKILNRLGLSFARCLTADQIFQHWGSCQIFLWANIFSVSDLVMHLSQRLEKVSNGQEMDVSVDGVVLFCIHIIQFSGRDIHIFLGLFDYIFLFITHQK